MNEYGFAHKDMLFSGLIWLRDTASAAADSFSTGAVKNPKLLLTLNTHPPSSPRKAIEDAKAQREIYSEEIKSDLHPIFHGPVQDKNGDAVLIINAIGSIRCGSDGAVNCACLIVRQYTVVGDPDSAIYRFLYMTEVDGYAVFKKPMVLHTWCIRNILDTTSSCDFSLVPE